MSDTTNYLSTWGWLLEEAEERHNGVRAGVIAAMRFAVWQGATNAEIARALGMSQPAVSRILNRKRWLTAWAILDLGHNASENSQKGGSDECSATQ